METRNRVPTDFEVRQHLENIRSRGGGALADLIERHAFQSTEPKKYDCPICLDTGWTEWKETIGGVTYEYAEECICQKRKREIRRLEESDLPDTSRMSLGRYKAEQDWQVRVLDKAYLFAGWSPKAADEIPPWLFIGGHPGTGKTHICTGVCMNLIGQGRRVVYQIWDDLVEDLRATQAQPEHRQIVRRLQEADVLYLDDFLRGSPTRVQISLAFEIINARYNNHRQTIFSSEHFIQEIVDKDHALGGRIQERARGFVVGIARDPGRDYRQRGGRQSELQGD